MSRTLALVAALLGAAVSASAQVLPDDVSSMPWVVDGGSVNAAVRSGDTVVLGGTFHRVARRSDVIGPFVVIDATSGALLAGAPDLARSAVTAAADDGAGGWYLAGTILRDSASFSGLVHVDGTGRRVPGFAPDGLEFFGIQAVVRAGNVLYLGGQFSTIGGVPRSHLAAFDLVTQTILPWNPGVTGTQVQTLAIDGSTVYVGGMFTSVGGSPRTGLAAVDAVTGNVLPWGPVLTGVQPMVRAFAQTADRVIVGGRFDTVDAAPRTGLAAFRKSEGGLTSFAPVIGGGLQLVTALSAAGGTLYVGGSFDVVGGSARQSLAALDLTSGATLPWAPGRGGIVYGMRAVGGLVFAAGEFTTTAGVTAFTTFDGTTGQIVPGLEPGIGGESRVLEVSGGRVLAGGGFATYRARPSRGLAAIDVSTGQLRPLPEVVGSVSALALSGSTLFLAGSFTRVGADTRFGVAAIDLTSGTVLPLAPVVEARAPMFPLALVNAIAVDAGRVWFSGHFSHVDGQPRASVAAVDTTTGLLDAFTPPSFNVTAPGITALAVASGKVWVAGDVTVAAPSRSRLVVLDAASGALDPLAPEPDEAVRRLVAGVDGMFLAGWFTQIGGAPRPGLARYSPAGTLTAWPAPGVTGDGALDVAGGLAVATVSSLNGVANVTTAALDPVVGQPLAWTPPQGGTYSSLWAWDAGVLASGERAGRPLVSPSHFARRIGSATPAALTDLGAFLQGSRLTLRWSPSASGALPTAYRLDVGTAPGAANLGTLPLGPTPEFVVDAPPGQYFVRISPVVNGVVGRGYRDIAFTVGGGCVTPPAPPVLSAAGVPPVLTWAAPAGVAPTGYELRAGVTPGVLDLVRLPLPASTSAFSTAGAPPGTYYTAVATVNACGVSVLSNEVAVVVPAPGAPAAPTALAATVSGRTVSLSWTSPAGAITGYVLEAGTAPGLANVIPGLALGGAPGIVAPNVPPGAYYVRVRAANGALVSVPSNEVLITVP